MRPSILVPCALAAILAACAPRPRDTIAGAASDTAPEAAESVYDSALARRLGADEYGMKTYVMALLKAGPDQGRDAAETAELMRAHLANIRRLAEEGSLVLAGPFGGDGELRGIYVFDVPTLEEARALTATDPAVRAGALEMDLLPWYGPAALPEVVELNRKVTKTTF